MRKGSAALKGLGISGWLIELVIDLSKNFFQHGRFDYSEISDLCKYCGSGLL